MYENWAGGDQAPATAFFVNPEPLNPRYLSSYDSNSSDRRGGIDGRCL